MSEPLPLADASPRLRRKPGRPKKTGDTLPEQATQKLGLQPRLVDVEGAAAYLSVSPWTIRDLQTSGRLPRVRLPLRDDREIRRLLFDVRYLDALIEQSREAGS